MTKELYTKVIAQLMTDASLATRTDEKERLSELCSDVLLARAEEYPA